MNLFWENWLRDLVVCQNTGKWRPKLVTNNGPSFPMGLQTKVEGKIGKGGARGPYSNYC